VVEAEREAGRVHARAACAQLATQGDGLAGPAERDLAVTEVTHEVPQVAQARGEVSLELAGAPFGKHAVQVRGLRQRLDGRAALASGVECEPPVGQRRGAHAERRRVVSRWRVLETLPASPLLHALQRYAAGRNLLGLEVQRDDVRAALLERL